MIGKIFRFLKECIIVFVPIILVFCFLFQGFKIPSGSMIPTFLVGDFLLVNKFCYGYSKNSFRIGKFNFPCPNLKQRLFARTKPQSGDVIVFRNEKHNDDNFIKRIIGMPGDKVQLIKGIVYINDKPIILKSDGVYFMIEDGIYTTYKKFIEILPNGYEHVIIKRQEFGESGMDDVGPYYVPENQYFVMGDNRDNSSDSRVVETVGCVPLENIMGKASVIYFSCSCSWWEILKWPFSIRFERMPIIIK